MAAIGFNIQHDGGHQAYSDRQWVNKLMALTLDLMGGSSYLWDWKHNSIHHTYPNIDGHDDDINVGFLGRLSPAAAALLVPPPPGHLPLAALRLPRDQVAPVRRLLQRRRRPDRRAQDPAPARARTWSSSSPARSSFFSLAFGIPMLLHPWWAVLAVYALAAFVSGVVLSVVFQLAHCVEEADFPVPVADCRRRRSAMETDWAVHQVQTTVDFARGNRVLCWFLGGLNFQIEHHLFSQDLPRPLPGAVEGGGRNLPASSASSMRRTRRSGRALAHARWVTLMGRPVLCRR